MSFIGFIILIMNKTPHYHLLSMEVFYKTACFVREECIVMYVGIYPVWLKMECIEDEPPLRVTAMQFVSCDSKQS